VKVKPVVPREQAERDVDEAISHHVQEGGADLALRFIDALEAAMRHVGTHPATGSPRYATELNLPGLRGWPLKRFPYLIFYAERTDHVDVWRLLHVKRDIPAWLSAEEEDQ
jgi:toxin ParE1/3/4